LRTALNLAKDCQDTLVHQNLLSAIGDRDFFFVHEERIFWTSAGHWICPPQPSQNLLSRKSSRLQFSQKKRFCCWSFSVTVKPLATVLASVRKEVICCFTPPWAQNRLGSAVSFHNIIAIAWPAKLVRCVIRRFQSPEELGYVDLD
jgi:hypothetical protein